jgi:3-hydroxybutyryl-CoA dehydrogenase
MKIEKVTVFGAGKFGARLAFHIAYQNVDVTVYDRDYGLLEEARTRFREFADYYEQNFEASKENVEAALANIAYSMDITEAAGNAHLIIEAVAEDLAAKKNFYRELQKTAPKNAIFVTTSKGLDPEMLASISGRPNKFLTLHFTGNLKEILSIEVISLPNTRKDILNSVVQFSEDIGMKVHVRHLEQQD